MRYNKPTVELEGDNMQETMLQNRKPVIRSYWLVGACIAVGFIASICIGNYPISIREIISILTGGASAWAALRWAPSRAGCLPWRL